MNNPFENLNMPGCFAMDATSRLDKVKHFNQKQCHQALQVPGLQKSVEQAIQRRLRKLEKGERQC